MSDNPYDPGTQAGVDYTPPSAEKPVSVKVFGILNLVFALMGICGVGFGAIALFGNVIPRGPDFPNPTLDLLDNSVGYRMFMILGYVLGIVFSVVLAVGGIGLLQYRRYGRSASIAYGWYGVAFTIITMVVNMLFLVLPAFQKIQPQQGGQLTPQQAGELAGAIGGTLGGCFGVVYPGILLFFMYRRNVVASLE